MPTDVRLDGETFLLQLLPQHAKTGDRIDARVVSLFPLQTAHLRHEDLRAAHLHTVYDVSNFHSHLNCTSARIAYVRHRMRGAVCELNHRITFRILESLDEHFYDAEQFSYHWALNGFGLSDAVLKKVYRDNAASLPRSGLHAHNGNH